MEMREYCKRAVRELFSPEVLAGEGLGFSYCVLTRKAWNVDACHARKPSVSMSLLQIGLVMLERTFDALIKTFLLLLFVFPT